jgi:aspartate kinase
LNVGFFGVVPGSLLAQVGRGYTDLCAALCAVGLEAAELQVWKEVDGIFTADPRKVPTARLISTITPEEAAELTYYGSEVIHPFTMEQVIRASIPIRIKNVENPKGGGTIIFPDDDNATSEGEEAVSPAASVPEPFHIIPSTAPSHGPTHDRLPTAVTFKDDILVLSIRSNRKTISHGFFGRIFGTLDKYGIVVDLIATSEVHVSMAINGSIRKNVLDRLTKDLQVVGEVSMRGLHLLDLN